MRLDLLQLDINILAPAVNDDVDLPARIAQTIKHLKRAFGAADAGNVERQEQQDVVGQIQSGDRHRVEGVLQVQSDAVIPLAQEM